MIDQTEKRVSLNGSWKLFYQTNSAYRKTDKHPVSYADLTLCQDVIEAQVPGNFDLDLMKNGIIEDPFFGQNVFKMQKYEAMHAFYAREFEYAPGEDGETVLTFEGLDTVAEVFVNGELIGKSDNMFVPQQFALTDLKNGKNDILVHILPACIEARKASFSAGMQGMKYEVESIRLRKSASMFGWDIMPRLTSGGIFRPVYIEQLQPERIRQAYLMTRHVDTLRKTASLSFFYDLGIDGDDLSEYSIRVEGVCGDSRFEAEDRLWFTAGKLNIRAENVRFWWPKGYGDPDLYDVTVTLKHFDEVIDVKKEKAGIRTTRLERTALTDFAFSGKFRFYVNEQPIFILGTNFVPIDAYHSRDRERLPKVTELLLDSGCNAIRIWGGGVYEDDYLYDFCDRNGILIWQDFMMACGTYPTDDEFCAVIRDEVTLAVRRLRGHASIMLWSGDNECDQSFCRIKPSMNKLTRQVIPEVLDREDPLRPYLPSSPFVDIEAEEKNAEAFTPENHLWGPRDYYKSNFYMNSVCSFASEMGYHGCPDIESIREFIPEDRLWPYQHNDDWMAHASAMEPGESGSYNYRIELMAKQTRELFGKVPDNLPDFVAASQISQAEAMKFFVEMFRYGQPDRTGIIWWNLIDGWPQFSDAVVDYYYRKKLAYYYIREVQRPLILSFKEPGNWGIELTAVNDTHAKQTISYKVTDLRSGECVCEGEAEVPEGVTMLEKVAYSQGAKTIYLMEWSYNGISGKNHYLAGNPPFSLEEYRELLKGVYDFN